MGASNLQPQRSPAPEMKEDLQSDELEMDLDSAGELGAAASPSTEAALREEREETGSDGLPVTQTPTPPPCSPLTPPTFAQELDPVSTEGDVPEPKERTEAEPRTSPAPLVLAPPAADVETGAGQSEEDEEEEEEEPAEEAAGRDRQQPVRVKAEPETQEEEGPKADLLLDDASNMSHGDGSSSGFLGSPAEPDAQSVSMELSLVPAGRSRSDSLLTETDDSLTFDPLKPDGEKVKRRGSPGRSRMKQVPRKKFCTVPGKTSISVLL